MNREAELLTVEMLISYHYLEVKSAAINRHLTDDFTIFVGLFYN